MPEEDPAVLELLQDIRDGVNDMPSRLARLLGRSNTAPETAIDEQAARVMRQQGMLPWPNQQQLGQLQAGWQSQLDANREMGRRWSETFPRTGARRRRSSRAGGQGVAFGSVSSPEKLSCGPHEGTGMIPS